MAGVNEKKGGTRLLFAKGRLWLLAGCGVLGVLLLLYGGGMLGQSDGATKSGSVKYDLSEYTKSLEASIGTLCSGVSGVSGVTVAVSLESGFEYVYATDSQNKADGASELKYITVGSGAGEGTVYITEKPPKIGGIGIVCRGGSDPEIVRRLTALVSAAYNVGANKIYITGS